jgi:hypothetical protein
MHLDNRLSTISTKKRKKKKIILNDKILNDFREHNKLMKRCGCKEKTIQEYIDYIQGKSKPLTTRKGLNKIPSYKSDHREKYPSFGDLIGNISAKPEKKYTGSLIKGIAVSHKSNLLPITSQEQAEDIAKMRRG